MGDEWSPSNASPRAAGSVTKESRVGPRAALTERENFGHFQTPVKCPDFSRRKSLISSEFVYVQHSKVSGF